MDSRRNVLVMWVVIAALCAPLSVTGEESKTGVVEPGSKAAPADSQSKATPGAQAVPASKSAPAAGSEKPQLDPERRRMIEFNRNRARSIIEEKRQLSDPKAVARLREKGATEKPYTLGQAVKADLAKGKTLRLTCEDNPQSVKEFLINIDGEKPNMKAFVVFADEKFKGAMADMSSTQSLEIETPDHPALLTFLNWQPAESGFAIRFQAKANEDFGKAIGKLLEPLQQNRTPPGIRPGEKMEPEARRTAFQEWLRKRRDAEATLQSETPKLRAQYKMAPDWETAKP